MRIHTAAIVSGGITGRYMDTNIPAWIQTEDGLRWEYVGVVNVDQSEPAPLPMCEHEEIVIAPGLRYRSLYGNTRYFWVLIKNGIVDAIHRNDRSSGIDYLTFRRGLEEFMAEDCSLDGYDLMLLPREDAFSLPTSLGTDYAFAEGGHA